jgi:hypothetical protein
MLNKKKAELLKNPNSGGSRNNQRQVKCRILRKSKRKWVGLEVWLKW